MVEGVGSSPEVERTEISKPRLILDKFQLGVAVLSFGFQQSPANEAARVYVGTQILESTHNPLAVGLGVGLATLAVEAASGAAISVALNSQSENIKKLKARIKKSNTEDASKSRAGDAALALGVGSGAVIAKRHYQESDRTFKKDMPTVAKAAGGIAIFSSLIGGLAAGGIEYADKVGLGSAAEIFVAGATDWRTYAVLLPLIQAAGMAKKKYKVLFPAPEKDTSPKEYKVKLVSDPEKVAKALELEQKVWDANKYGSLDVYEKYLPQSRIFGAFNREEECIGMTRLFAGRPETPPFMELPISDQATQKLLAEECRNGQAEELGTVAVDKSAPTIEVALGLWRAAYRDATSRNIKTWGIIMEPQRVRIMNKRYGFTFRQIGPELDYQGGMCAAHVMDLSEVDAHMKETKPEYYDWFVNQPLDQ